MIPLAHGAQNDYAQGRGGAGGVFQVGTYNHRHYNRVWHASGYYWQVYYSEPGGGVHGFADGTSNPTEWPSETGYGNAKCYNFNDNSFVLWTCQTTGA